MSSQSTAQDNQQHSLLSEHDDHNWTLHYQRCLDMVESKDNHIAGIKELKNMLETPTLRPGYRIKLLLALGRSSRNRYECRKWILEADSAAKRLETEYKTLGIVEARISEDKMVEGWLSFFSHTALEILTLRLLLKKSKPEAVGVSELEDATIDTANPKDQPMPMLRQIELGDI
jgi:hypothetical protein